ncbi:MAG: GNAT family protein [Candidatus Paceibacterota bacterium]
MSKMSEDICLVPREGENVRLRPPRKEDAKFFVQMLNNPRINRFLTRRFPLPRIEEETWIENNAEQIKNKEAAHFTIELMHDEKENEVIGICGLADIDLVNDVGEAGILLGEDYLEEGYGTEATKLLLGFGFDALNLHRINAAAVGYNERSIALQKKLGFKKVGAHKEMIRIKGERYDLVIFGILEDTWRNQNSGN